MIGRCHPDIRASIVLAQDNKATTLSVEIKIEIRIWKLLFPFALKRTTAWMGNEDRAVGPQNPYTEKKTEAVNKAILARFPQFNTRVGATKARKTTPFGGVAC
jgi:hypothetical protein